MIVILYLFIVPLLVVLAARKWPIIEKISPMVVLYIIGLIVGNVGIMGEKPLGICTNVSNVVVLISIPLFIAADQPEIPGKASDLFALWTKNNLPCEIHAFTDASHGFGYRPNGRSENMWITLFVNFMKKVHFID